MKGIKHLINKKQGAKEKKKFLKKRENVFFLKKEKINYNNRLNIFLFDTFFVFFT